MTEIHFGNDNNPLEEYQVDLHNAPRNLITVSNNSVAGQLITSEVYIMVLAAVFVSAFGLLAAIVKSEADYANHK